MEPKKNLLSVNTEIQLALPNWYIFAICSGIKFSLIIPFEGLAFFISAMIEGFFELILLSILLMNPLDFLELNILLSNDFWVSLAFRWLIKSTL